MRHPHLHAPPRQALDPAHVDFAHHQLQGDWRTVAHGQWETWAGGQDGPAAPGTNGHTAGAGGGSPSGAAAGALAAMGWVGRDGLPGQLELLSPVHQRYSQRQPDVRRPGRDAGRAHHCTLTVGCSGFGDRPPVLLCCHAAAGHPGVSGCLLHSGRARADAPPGDRRRGRPAPGPGHEAAGGAPTPGLSCLRCTESHGCRSVRRTSSPALES